MSLKEDITANSVTLIKVSSENYNTTMSNLLSEIADQSLLYITLNKTKESILDTMKNNKVTSKNIAFIDGIKATALTETKNEKDCKYLKTPNALKELEAYINEDKHELIIFDSLSSLLIYDPVPKVTKFITKILPQVKSRKIVLIALKGEKEEELINNISKSINKTIEF